MNEVIRIKNQEFEYDFLSGWIKYNRLKKGISQEALAYGICSKSHLSYFESGKRKLRTEIIEDLLTKLDVVDFSQVKNIGTLRQKLYHMTLCIEYLNLDEAKQVFEEVSKYESVIEKSPYNIEYKIYQLHYDYFVSDKDQDELKEEIKILDKIYSNLTDELKYLYMLTTGRFSFKHVSHKEGIRRLKLALSIKETPIINYYMGFSHCFDDNHLRAVLYFEKSLESYSSSGRYINSVLCHNYLGVCYTSLKMYKKAEDHFKTGITGAEHFDIKIILGHLYNNISHLYMCLEEYEIAKKWIKQGIITFNDPVLPASNLVEIHEKLNEIEDAKKVALYYLNPPFDKSRYHLMLYFNYLRIFTTHDELYYEKLSTLILPFYESINYIEICDFIKKK